MIPSLFPNLSRTFFAAKAKTSTAQLDPKSFETYNFPHIPETKVTVENSMVMEWFHQMTTIRRMEMLADTMYKAKHIGGFCHLYDGQEAVIVGVESVLTHQDLNITAYREHGHQYLREGSVHKIFAELFGKATGSTEGKGGSMHLYRPEQGFYGGNGIVGAQIPIGTGLALSLKYKKTVLDQPNDNVVVAFYGDGAANQGQIHEAMNMASLWKLPIIYICENNKFGMGTSDKRAAANIKYYTRGWSEHVPGLKADGMNIFSVRSTMQLAKDYVLENGPLLVEFDTYRYKGHSMSDPGTTYRSREDVKAVRTSRDPIKQVEQFILENKIATEDELKTIAKDIAASVKEDAQKALADPEPQPEELFTHSYSDLGPIDHVRGVTLARSYKPGKGIVDLSVYQ